MLRSRAFRNFILLGVALGVGAALLFETPNRDSPILNRSPSGSSPLPSVPKIDSPPRSANSSPSTHSGTELPVYSGVNYLPEVIAQADSLNSSSGNTDEDIGTLLNLMEIYRKVNKGNPIGLNHEIVQQLRGANLKRFAVLPYDFPGLNSEGEAADRWGTPYFFHAVSDDWMEIRSAGPDGKLWSKDDISSPTLPVKAPAAAFARVFIE